MPNDPKWRLIARRAKATIPEVVSTFLHMMINASTSGLDGEMKGWNDEVVGIALDVDTEVVTTIRDAMQGVVLEGDNLMGWRSRQPKREDFTAIERSRHYRIRKEEEARAARGLTLPAPVTPSGPVQAEAAPPAKKKRRPREMHGIATAIDQNYQPDAADKAAAEAAGLDKQQFRQEWAHFRDYHVARGNTMVNWHAAWGTWLSNYQKGAFAPPGKLPQGHESNFIAATRELLGKIEDATPTDQTAPLASTLPDSAFRIAEPPALTSATDAGSARPLLALGPIRSRSELESDLD